MTTGRSTKKGGRPPVRGGVAKPMLVIKGRKYRDTAANRLRFGLPVAGDAKPPVPAPEAKPPVVAKPTAEIPPGASDEAQVRASLGMPEPSAPEAGAPAPVIAEPQVDYRQVVEIVDLFVGTKWPKAKMLDHERQAIGQAFDACIAKWFPALKTAGPEVALLVAVTAYGGRVWLASQAAE